MAALYNAPPGVASTMGTQFNTSYWDRKSLIDAAEQMFFSPLADVRSMPAHMGKELKVYYYVPLLDDRNVNDQGLDADGATYAGGNMYGSSTDVGTITARMPTMTEEGGRVNRVGFTRIERSGSLQEHGFFMEFTEDSLTFDTDSDLYGHMSREMVAGANEITEDLLQIDLLSAAGTVVFTGVATQDSEITGEGADPSVVTYSDLKKLSITLDDNRTPKKTKIIKGSRMTDTVTINASRILYIGSELQTTVENMTQTIGSGGDTITVAAFQPVRKYADAAVIMNGEIGTVGDFRIVVVPNMMKWAGAGEAVGTNPGFAETSGSYDIFPMLVVGDESFATVGLQNSGKKGAKQKFKIIMKKPGEAMATVHDPFGKIGFTSITFNHGFIGLRPERIGLVKTVAPE
jgi:N4-gp56 family major capsid protein